MRFNLTKIFSVFIGSAIVKDMVYVFSSKTGATIFGFIGSIIIIRELGPVNYGLFATALAFIPLLTGLFDFGLNTATIKFGSLYLKDDKRRSDILFKIIGKQKTIISIIVPAIGLITARFIAVNLYNKPDLVYPLRISMMCIIVSMLVSYLLTVIQARQEYLKSSIITLVTALVRLGSIMALYFFFHLLTVKSMLFLTLGLNFFSLFFCSYFMNVRFVFTKYEKEEGKLVRRDVFNFTKWVMISSFCWPFLKRLDIFMLNYYVDSSLVGIYACAFQLVSPLMMLKGSFHNVLLPKISRIASYSGYMNYAKKFTLLSGALCIIFIPGIVYARPIIEFIFGAKYSVSAYIFQIMVVRLMFMLVLNPLHLIAYSAGHPWIISGKDIIALFLNALLNIILIPILGISGAAFGALLATVVGGIIPIIYIYYKILLPIGRAEVPTRQLVPEDNYSEIY